MTTYLAWHFAPSTMRTAHTEEPIVVGETLAYDGTPVLCRRGLHASERALDALVYAPTECCLCRVEVGDFVVRGYDKIAGTTRRCLWALDAATTSRVLRDFSCRVAEQALTAAGVTDHRSWDAITAARAYERGEIDAAARAAASAAAWDAAGDAAGDAASAASAAASAAARAAASAAASAAARAVARDVAWAAARVAARDAARDAAWDAQSDLLASLAEQAHAGVDVLGGLPPTSRDGAAGEGRRCVGGGRAVTTVAELEAQARRVGGAS